MMYRAEWNVQYRRLIEPVVNDPTSVEYCRAVASKLAGEQNVLPFAPMMGGEDFGGFLQARPGAFVAVGQAEPEQGSPHNFSLHSPQYDFNDRIIPLAAEYFAELAESRLPIDQDARQAPAFRPEKDSRVPSGWRTKYA